MAKGVNYGGSSSDGWTDVLRRATITVSSREFPMRKSAFRQPNQFIANPHCERCGAMMWLARIEPDEADHDRRTFECIGCDHQKTEVVKYR